MKQKNDWVLSRICLIERDLFYLVQESRFWTKLKHSVFNKRYSGTVPKRFGFVSRTISECLSFRFWTLLFASHKIFFFVNISKRREGGCCVSRRGHQYKDGKDYVKTGIFQANNLIYNLTYMTIQITPIWQNQWWNGFPMNCFWSSLYRPPFPVRFVRLETKKVGCKVFRRLPICPAFAIGTAFPKTV
jgi:hypothetical protein